MDLKRLIKPSVVPVCVALFTVAILVLFAMFTTIKIKDNMGKIGVITETELLAFVEKHTYVQVKSKNDTQRMDVKDLTELLSIIRSKGVPEHAQNVIDLYRAKYTPLCTQGITVDKEGKRAYLTYGRWVLSCPLLEYNSIQQKCVTREDLNAVLELSRYFWDINADSLEGLLYSNE